MRFSAPIATVLALCLFSIPSLAASSSTSTSTAAAATGAVKAGNVKGGNVKPAISQAQAKQVAQNLREYHHAAHKELQDCAKAKTLPHCLSRAVKLPKGSNSTLTAEETDKYTKEYHLRLGSELGNCTKKNGFKSCKDRIVNADDDAKLVARGKVRDFFNGFVEGFTGVFHAAGQMADAAIPVISQAVDLANKFSGPK